MAYKCPRCGEPVQRGRSTSGQLAAGVVGAMFFAAFGAFKCKNCEKIPRSEFPAEVRQKISTGTFILVVSGIALIFVVLWAVSLWKT
ncbi:MAG: hypothetical protein ABSF88_07790 [Candidatus Aminicenantales bacterium]